MFKLFIIVSLTVLAGVQAKPGNAVAAHIAGAPIAAYTAPIAAAYTAPYAAYTAPYASAYTAPYASAYTAPYAAAFPAPYAAAYTAPFAPYAAAFTAPLSSTAHSHRVDVYNKYNPFVAAPAKLITSYPAAAYINSPYIGSAAVAAAPAKLVNPAARLVAPAAALY